MGKFIWAEKRVLVVGGAGFIGSHTVDALIDRGASVAIADNFATGNKENCNRKASLHTLDAASVPGMAEVFKREEPDFVMIFSAVVDIPFAIKNPVLTAQDITATVNVLAHSAEHGVKKVLYGSSGFIYGNASKLPTPETEPTQPLNPYNISKGVCENYIRFFRSHYGLPFVALRYAPLYGPRRKAGPIIDYIRKISQGMRAEIYGSKGRDYTYIDDIVRANLLALETNIRSVEPIFNVGTGKDFRLDEIYALIARFLGRPENTPIRRPGKLSEVDRSRLDIRKAKRAFGFQPKVTLEEGLQRTIDWFLGLPTSRKQ